MFEEGESSVRPFQRRRAFPSILLAAVVACSSRTPEPSSVDAPGETGRAELLATPPTRDAVPFGARSSALSTPAQTGFTDTAVITGLRNPVAVRFASDGRVFVAEKRGRILSYAGLDSPTPTLVVDLSAAVYDFWDRGLLGFALDPNFPTRPYLYVLYTYDAALGETAPRWNDACPSPPGATSDGCVASGRLSRLHVGAGGLVDGEEVLINDWPQQFPSHSIGELAFGPDGALYASAGDGASFTFADYGQAGNPRNPLGDPPVGVGGTQTPPTALGGALRSQSFRRPAGMPVSLDGTVIRVDPQTGAGLPDNPNAGHPDPNARRIVAYGFRNPFRLTIRPGTSEVWVGDVGWNTWEEIDRIVDPKAGTANFGWPCYEGAGRQGGYDGANLDLCETLYAQGATAWSTPHYTYNHGAKVVAGESCPTGGSSVAGLAFYTGSRYPSEYRNALFWGDYSRQCIWAMLPDTNGLPDPARLRTFVTGAPLVGLTTGPGGDLFYVDFSNGAVRRLSYQVPQALASASPTGGSAPLTVAFDASASTPGIAGETLTYAWDLDGDGQFDDATGTTASFVYGTAGTYQARLRVEDPRGGSAVSAPLTITVDEAVNTPPVPVIDTPARSLNWAVGDPIPFSGHATDAEDGTLGAAALRWTLLMHHCPSNCHIHEVQSFDGVASGSFPAPDHDYPAYLELVLTATDARGAQSSTSVRLDPRTVVLTFDTVPSGLQLAVGAAAQPAPLQQTVIVGSTNSVSAPTPQTLAGVSYDFSAWSDGAAASHDLVAPASETRYVATFNGQQGGLTGQYFDNADFTALKLTRVDGTVGFNWGSGSPAPGIGADTFSARWTGQVVARYSETYTFYTLSDDGVRLWVNGTLLIDNWTLHSPTENRGTIALQAGQAYDVVMEFYENKGGAVAQLLWSSLSQPKEIIPATQLRPEITHGLRAEYFDDVALTQSRRVRVDPNVNFDWGIGSPDPSIDPEAFSVRWSGRLEAPTTESYTFRLRSDEGVRMWLDGTLVIDRWTAHPVTDDLVTVPLVAGRRYELVIEYYDLSGPAVAQLFWSSPTSAEVPVPSSALTPWAVNASYGTGTGLKAEYFDASNFTAPFLTRVDGSVDFNWGNGAPASGMGADTFSVRWTGQVQPRFSETYQFITTSDDGVRLWVNGVRVVDSWTLHSARDDSGQIALQAGQKYDVVMEFFENGGQAVAKLSWSSPSQPRQIIPPSQLYPAP